MERNKVLIAMVLVYGILNLSSVLASSFLGDLDPSQIDKDQLTASIKEDLHVIEMNNSFEHRALKNLEGVTYRRNMLVQGSELVEGEERKLYSIPSFTYGELYSEHLDVAVVGDNLEVRLITVGADMDILDSLLDDQGDYYPYLAVSVVGENPVIEYIDLYFDDIAAGIFDAINSWNSALLNVRAPISIELNQDEDVDPNIHIIFNNDADYYSNLAPDLLQVAYGPSLVENISLIEEGNNVITNQVILAMPNILHEDGNNLITNHDNNNRYIHINPGMPLTQAEFNAFFPLVGEGEDIRRSASNVVAIMVRHGIGRSLGLDLALYNQDMTSGIFPVSGRLVNPFDPMQIGTENRIHNYVAYVANHNTLPPIPDLNAETVSHIFSIDQGFCDSDLQLQECMIDIKAGVTSEGINGKCMMRESACRSIQIVATGDLNRRYKNTDLKLYIKDSISAEKKFVFNFANTGAPDVIPSYTANSRYYFPFGYDEVYLGIGNDEVKIDLSKYMFTQNFYTTVTYNTSTWEVTSNTRLPHSVELRNEEVLYQNGINTPKEIGAWNLGNLVGSEQYLFGIDLNLSINIRDYELDGRKGFIEVFSYYKAYGMIDGLDDWQAWRGYVKVGQCGRNVALQNFYNPTGQCFMSIPRLFVPIGTHEIAIQVLAYVQDENSNDPYEHSSHTYHVSLHSSSAEIGGIGIQDQSYKKPHSFGSLNFDSKGVMRFIKYKGKYPIRSYNFQMVCDNKGCTYNPYLKKKE